MKAQVAQQTQERELLLKVVQMVSDLDLDKVLKEIVKIAIKIAQVDSCFVYIYDARRKELVLRASKNPHPKILQDIHMKLGVGITGWVAQHKQTVVISERAFADPRFHLFRDLPEDRYHAFLSIPIMHTHHVVGVFNLQNKSKHVFPPAQIELLTTIGKLVGGAVENARLVEETFDLRDALETRKLVEKAKGILMKSKGVSEDEAYRLIKKKSMDLRKPSKEICEAIILSEQIG
jgi:uroporphyrinogen-III synthase